ncbi:unnamed protein product [Periconia digitata]|uniref:Uncharacterized protein n=1 Tax=Periconia digitata TaxID=1303443 RepID=A0A9W4UJ24_9PLEO|nr:unnamed protein product [Periconia digitata]
MHPPVSHRCLYAPNNPIHLFEDDVGPVRPETKTRKVAGSLSGCLLTLARASLPRPCPDWPTPSPICPTTCNRDNVWNIQTCCLHVLDGYKPIVCFMSKCQCICSHPLTHFYTSTQPHIFPEHESIPVSLFRPNHGSPPSLNTCHTSLQNLLCLHSSHPQQTSIPNTKAKSCMQKTHYDYSCRSRLFVRSI